ncbi:MAG: hypothetical protein ACFFAN_08690 [Promethearchaeota archaeon]
MNISAALKKIKVLRNEIGRKIKIRKDNFYTIIPKNKSLEEVKSIPESKIIDFYKLTEEVEDIATEITNLREQILKTNINTNVEIDGENITLARLKLLIDDIRSELSQLLGITTVGYYDSPRRRRIITTEEEEKEVAQLTDLELENKIMELEDKKVRYENKLDYMNAITDIIK